MNSLPVNTFKQALNANRRQVGLWVTLAHQQVAEAAEGAASDAGGGASLQVGPGATAADAVDAAGMAGASSV